MCKKCRELGWKGKKGLSLDPKDMTAEQAKFLEEHPAVRAFLQSQHDQIKANGGSLEVVVDKMKAIEAWDRSTKGAAPEDRIALANMIALSFRQDEAQQILDDPKKWFAWGIQQAGGLRELFDSLPGLKVLGVTEGGKGVAVAEGLAVLEALASGEKPDEGKKGQGRLTLAEIEELTGEKSNAKLPAAMPGKGGNA